MRALSCRALGAPQPEHLQRLGGARCWSSCQPTLLRRYAVGRPRHAPSAAALGARLPHTRCQRHPRGGLSSRRTHGLANRLCNLDRAVRYRARTRARGTQGVEPVFIGSHVEETEEEARRGWTKAARNGEGAASAHSGQGARASSGTSKLIRQFVPSHASRLLPFPKTLLFAIVGEGGANRSSQHASLERGTSCYRATSNAYACNICMSTNGQHDSAAQQVDFASNSQAITAGPRQSARICRWYSRCDSCCRHCCNTSSAVWLLQPKIFSLGSQVVNFH